MDKSVLTKLIRSFEPLEKREAERYLKSPFFNLRQDVIDLFHQLSGAQTLEKQDVWKNIYNAAPYDDQKMRHLMSYLHKLLEDFLAIKETMADQYSRQLKLAVAYRKRGMNAAFEKNIRSLEKQLEEHPLRNQSFLETKHKMLWEGHQLAYAADPADITRLEEISKNIDLIFLSEKLKVICLFAQHQSVYKSSADPDRDTEIIRMAERPEYCDHPAVAIYLHCFYMLRYPEDEQHFYRLKALLPEQTGRFTTEEMHSFFILAINYCVKKINAGVEHMIAQVLDLYKEGLEKNYLLEDGVLSRFTYHNIVAAGLGIDDREWVRYFIQQYKNQVEKKFRESSYSYNLARLEYASKNYTQVMELLQNANYRDPLLNLQAKTLLIKTYYDTDELDILQSHLDAMRNYIHRKAILGYHRTNYLNIIRYTEKLLRLRPNDKKEIAALRTAVENEVTLTERQFFQNALLGI